MLDAADLAQQTRKTCLEVLYKMCHRYALLPRTVQVPVLYDRTSNALYRGGFADVWKGKHCDREVAVKVMRTYSNSDLQRILGVSRLKISLHVELLTTPYVEILQGSSGVESPSASECFTIHRCDDGGGPVRDDIRLDGKRKHQHIC